jgi:putative spermidine/putrescine transport system ATP-binding protein
MSLVFNEVSYHYPNTQQGVNDVTLDIQQGELVAVIGPSGSGKSTLLKLVSGLTQGHRGSIVLNGQNLSGRPVHTRNIGMVFQSYALFPHLNVLDNVAYGLKLRAQALGVRHKKAMDLLGLMGMSEFAQRSVAQLSGGQQQRVALARALAIDPGALLLDEPLAALDASIRGQLRDQIRQIQQRFKATTLLVTHDQEEALTMADRVAVMKDGRVLQFAAPRELYDRPQSKAVAEFVGLSNILPATIRARGELDLGFCMLKTSMPTPALGAKVFVLIRPEHVQSNPDLGAVNVLQGRSGLQRYLGSISRFDFHVGHDSMVSPPLLVESSSIGPLESNPVNAIAISPDRVHLLAS